MILLNKENCNQNFPITGIGPRQALKLFEFGFSTIESLRTEQGLARLSSIQKIGLLRYEDLLQRMPREEATEIVDVVTSYAQELLPGVRCIACGSYRRGKESCGDVDILLAPPSGCRDVNIIRNLYLKLKESGFLTDDLTEPKEHSDTYMGICRLRPGKF